MDKCLYSLQKFETIRSFAKNIREGKINLDNAVKNQDYLLLETGDFNKTATQDPGNFSKKKRKRDTVDSPNALYEGCEIVINAFKSRVFPVSSIKGTHNPDVLARIAQASDHKVLILQTSKY